MSIPHFPQGSALGTPPAGADWPFEEFEEIIPEDANPVFDPAVMVEVSPFRRRRAMPAGASPAPARREGRLSGSTGRGAGAAAEQHHRSGDTKSSKTAKSPRKGPRTRFEAAKGGWENASSQSGGGAYFTSRFEVASAQEQYVRGLVGHLPTSLQLFIKHVLVSSSLSRTALDNDGFVPVPSPLIGEELLGDAKANTEAMWRPAVQAGLLEWRADEMGYCREFRVRPEILLAFLERGPQTSAESLGAKRKDLISGQRVRTDKGSPRPAVEIRFKDLNNNYYPGLLDAVLRYFKHGLEGEPVRCPYRPDRIEAHLLALQRTMNSAEASFVAAGRVEGSSAHRVYVQARAVYLNDAFWYDQIRKQDIRDEGEGIYSFRPAYEVQHLSGRLTGTAALQNASRAMKMAAFDGVPGLKNWDLKSSQAFGLKQQFEGAGIDAGWLETYLAGTKQAYYEPIGIDEDTWKRCLYALFTGARLLTSLRRFESYEQLLKRRGVMKVHVPEIIKYVREYASAQNTDAVAVYKRLAKGLKPIKVRIDEWHGWLLNVFFPENSHVGDGGCHYVRNACGVSFSPDLYKSEHDKKAKFAAFILQGQEAAFIHHVTLLGKEFGYRVVSNEHDGVITLGDIPEEAQRIARERSGLRYGELVEKKFC